ncbi:MAG: hypothetical protein JKY49_06580 [Cohaesibacteraceae bacterium]|nr:hypothetical protein [Cohaesibacteraceae bacterium]
MLSSLQASGSTTSKVTLALLTDDGSKSLLSVKTTTNSTAIANGPTNTSTSNPVSGFDDQAVIVSISNAAINPEASSSLTIFDDNAAPFADETQLFGTSVLPATETDDDSDTEEAGIVEPASETEENEESEGVEGEELTEEQEKQVRDLKQTDAAVRAHEQAHSAAGGPYASSPSYEFQEGPDGRRYAVAGEVSIDASPVRGNPQATIRKMDIVIQAALAPADPSSQDQAVARSAQKARSQAQAELQKQRAEEAKTGKSDEDSKDGEELSPLEQAIQSSKPEGSLASDTLRARQGYASAQTSFVTQDTTSVFNDIAQSALFA